MNDTIERFTTCYTHYPQNEELHPSAVPTPRPRGKDKSQPDTQHVTRYENNTSETDFIVLEEVVQPSLRGATDTSPDSRCTRYFGVGR